MLLSNELGSGSRTRLLWDSPCCLKVSALWAWLMNLNWGGCPFHVVLWWPMLRKHTEDGCDKRAQQLYLVTEKSAPVVPNRFQLCQCYCRLCYPKRASQAWDPCQLQLSPGTWSFNCDCPKLPSLYFDILVDAACVVCHQLLSSRHWPPCRRLCRDA